MKEKVFDGREINWNGEGLYELARQMHTDEKQWWQLHDFESVTYAFRVGRQVEWIEEEDIIEIDRETGETKEI